MGIIKSAKISTSASGDTTLVTNPGGSAVLRVLAYSFTVNAAVAVKFKSGATDLTGAFPFGSQGQGFASGFAARTEGLHCGHFETAPGDDLVLNLSGAVAVGGVVSYEIG